MRRNILTGVLVMVSLYSCRSEKKTDEMTNSAASVATGSINDSLSYAYDSVKVYSKTPVSKNKMVTDTAKAVVVFPAFKDQAINKLVEDRVVGLAGKQGIYQTYKDLAAGFINEFDLYQAKNPASTETWFEHMNLKVVANYPNYLSILHTYSDYKGGAHANTLFTYFNYNPRTSQTITLDSLINVDGMSKLRVIAEAIFRKDENLPAKASLSQAYFFADGIFSLPETFTVTKEGIQFLYNPYEIKPFAAGTTTLLVPFSKIHDIMKESSILTNFKHNGSI